VTMWIGFNWLRISSSGELLWTLQWTFGFHERREFVEWATVSLSRTLLDGVSPFKFTVRLATASWAERCLPKAELSQCRSDCRE
jgi:hypothetical protein